MMWGTFNTAIAYSMVAVLPPCIKPLGRHHVPGIPENKELPGISLCEEGGVDPGIGTGNEERAGSLVFRKPGEEFLLLAEHLGPKLEEAFDEFFHPYGSALSTVVLDVAIDCEH